MFDKKISAHAVAAHIDTIMSGDISDETFKILMDLQRFLAEFPEAK